VTVREALELSLNVPTVRAAARVGIPRVVDTARRCGIDSELPAVPSLALGTAEVTPLELAEAYGTLAHGGIHTVPWVVRSVTDSDGGVLYSHTASPERVLSAQTAYQVRDILEGVFERGTARSARGLGYYGPGAGKTGTTDDTRDSWFVGYTEGLLSLVWIGYDDNSRTGLTGASGALPIWVDFMSRSTMPGSRRVPLPDDIVVVRIDPDTGLLAVGGCPRTVRERFIRGTEPQEECAEHLGHFRRWWRRLREGDRPTL
jgi:penicillin-binding protein 1B